MWVTLTKFLAPQERVLSRCHLSCVLSSLSIPLSWTHAYHYGGMEGGDVPSAVMNEAPKAESNQALALQVEPSDPLTCAWHIMINSNCWPIRPDTCMVTASVCFWKESLAQDDPSSSFLHSKCRHKWCGSRHTLHLTVEGHFVINCPCFQTIDTQPVLLDDTQRMLQGKA